MRERGKKREKRKERKEKGENVRGRGWSKGRCDFFLLIQALQVIYKWNQERAAKENQE